MWALRHPASGYVQGINDLVTPLYAVFLEPYASLTSSTVEASEEALLAVEADVYWCLTRLLDGIQVGGRKGAVPLRRPAVRAKSGYRPTPE